MAEYPYKRPSKRVVACVDCKHHRPSGKYDVMSDVCLANSTIRMDHVKGKMTVFAAEYCTTHNRDGLCKKFEAKPEPVLKSGFIPIDIPIPKKVKKIMKKTRRSRGAAYIKAYIRAIWKEVTK